MSSTSIEKDGQTATTTRHQRVAKTVAEKYSDVTLRLIEDHGDEFGPLTPEKEKKLRRKLYIHVLLLVSVINLLLFMDKASLGYTAILGLFEETGITDAQYNNLNTFFYVGYIAAQWPASYLLQRLPFGKFIAVVIFFWSVIVFCHCAATNYAGLAVLRILLGVVEAVVVPAIEMTFGMFFNREEHSFIQPIFWISCDGAGIPAGFIAYGVLFAKSSILPWKIFMIILGGITFFMSIYAWFFYPNNPAEAWFLTLEEKVHTVQRVQKSSQSSIEQKQFKKSQFIETLRDPVSWLFALQSFTIMYSNNLTYGQQTLLTKSLGVSTLGTTLVAAAGSGFAVAVCIVAGFLLKWYPGHLAIHSTIWCIPAVAGGIGMVTVSWENKLGLLACLILAGHTYGVTYIIALGWTTSSTSGYTKKLTRNILFMIGYSVGNAVSPQIWVKSNGPRYYGAWASMIVVSWVGTPVILWVIHFILSRRNKERLQLLAELSDDEQSGFVEQIDENGQVSQRKTELAMLDLTDFENKTFIYPL